MSSRGRGRPRGRPRGSGRGRGRGRGCQNTRDTDYNLLPSLSMSPDCRQPLPPSVQALENVMHHHTSALPPGYPLSPHPGYPYSPHNSVIQPRERSTSRSPSRITTATQAVWQSPPPPGYPHHANTGYISYAQPPDPMYVVRQSGEHSSRKNTSRRKSRRDDSDEREGGFSSTERDGGYPSVEGNSVYQTVERSGTYMVVERHTSFAERSNAYPNYSQDRLQTVDPRDLAPSYSQPPTPGYHQHIPSQGMSDDPDVQYVGHVRGRGKSVERESKSSRRRRDSSSDRHHHHQSHSMMHSSHPEPVQFEHASRSRRQQSPDCETCIPDVRRKSKSKSRRASPTSYISPATPGCVDAAVSTSYGQHAPSFPDLARYPNFSGHDTRRSDVSGRGPGEVVWVDRGQQVVHSRSSSGERVMPGQIEYAASPGRSSHTRTYAQHPGQCIPASPGGPPPSPVVSSRSSYAIQTRSCLPPETHKNNPESTSRSSRHAQLPNLDDPAPSKSHRRSKRRETERMVQAPTRVSSGTNPDYTQFRIPRHQQSSHRQPSLSPSPPPRPDRPRPPTPPYPSRPASPPTPFSPRRPSPSGRLPEPQSPRQQNFHTYDNGKSNVSQNSAQVPAREAMERQTYIAQSPQRMYPQRDSDGHRVKIDTDGHRVKIDTGQQHPLHPQQHAQQYRQQHYLPQEVQMRPEQLQRQNGSQQQQPPQVQPHLLPQYHHQQLNHYQQQHLHPQPQQQNLRQQQQTEYEKPSSNGHGALGLYPSGPSFSQPQYAPMKDQTRQTPGITTGEPVKGPAYVRQEYPGVQPQHPTQMQYVAPPLPVHDTSTQIRPQYESQPRVVETRQPQQVGSSPQRMPPWLQQTELDNQGRPPPPPWRQTSEPMMNSTAANPFMLNGSSHPYSASMNCSTSQTFVNQPSQISVAGVQPAGSVSLVTGSSLTNDQAFSQQIILVDSLGQSNSLQCMPVVDQNQQQILSIQASASQDLNQLLEASRQQASTGTDPNRMVSECMGTIGAQVVTNEPSAAQNSTTFTSDSSAQTQTECMNNSGNAVGGQVYVRRLSGDFNQAQISLIPHDDGQAQNSIPSENGLVVPQNTSVGDAIISQAFSLQHLFDDDRNQPQSTDPSVILTDQMSNVPVDLSGIQGVQIQQAPFEPQQNSLEINETQLLSAQQIQFDQNALQGIQQDNSSTGLVDDMMLIPSIEQHQVFVLEPPGQASQTRAASISGTRRSSWHTPEHSISGSLTDEDHNLVIDLSAELADEDDVIFTSNIGEQPDSKASMAQVVNNSIAELGEHGLRIASVFSLATSRRTRRTMSDSVLQEVEHTARQQGVSISNIADNSVVSNGSSNSQQNLTISNVMGSSQVQGFTEAGSGGNVDGFTISSRDNPGSRTPMGGNVQATCYTATVNNSSPDPFAELHKLLGMDMASPAPEDWGLKDTSLSFEADSVSVPHSSNRTEPERLGTPLPHHIKEPATPFSRYGPRCHYIKNPATPLPLVCKEPASPCPPVVKEPRTPAPLCTRDVSVPLPITIKGPSTPLTSPNKTYGACMEKELRNRGTEQRLPAPTSVSERMRQHFEAESRKQAERQSEGLLKIKSMENLGTGENSKTSNAHCSNSKASRQCTREIPSHAQTFSGTSEEKTPHRTVKQTEGRSKLVYEQPAREARNETTKRVETKSAKINSTCSSGQDIKAKVTANWEKRCASGNRGIATHDYVRGSHREVDKERRSLQLLADLGVAKSYQKGKPLTMKKAVSDLTPVRKDDDDDDDKKSCGVRGRRFMTIAGKRKPGPDHNDCSQGTNPNWPGQNAGEADNERPWLQNTRTLSQDSSDDEKPNEESTGSRRVSTGNEIEPTLNEQMDEEDDVFFPNLSRSPSESSSIADEGENFNTQISRRSSRRSDQFSRDRQVSEDGETIADTILPVVFPPARRQRGRGDQAQRQQVLRMFQEQGLQCVELEGQHYVVLEELLSKCFPGLPRSEVERTRLRDLNLLARTVHLLGSGMAPDGEDSVSVLALADAARLLHFFQGTGTECRGGSPAAKKDSPRARRGSGSSRNADRLDDQGYHQHLSPVRFGRRRSRSSRSSIGDNGNNQTEGEGEAGVLDDTRSSTSEQTLPYCDGHPLLLWEEESVVGRDPQNSDGEPALSPHTMSLPASRPTRRHSYTPDDRIGKTRDKDVTHKSYDPNSPDTYPDAGVASPMLPPLPSYIQSPYTPSGGGMYGVPTDNERILLECYSAPSSLAPSSVRSAQSVRLLSPDRADLHMLEEDLFEGLTNNKPGSEGEMHHVTSASPHHAKEVAASSPHAGEGSDDLYKDDLRPASNSHDGPCTASEHSAQDTHGLSLLEKFSMDIGYNGGHSGGKDEMSLSEKSMHHLVGEESSAGKSRYVRDRDKELRLARDLNNRLNAIVFGDKDVIRTGALGEERDETPAVGKFVADSEMRAKHVEITAAMALQSNDVKHKNVVDRDFSDASNDVTPRSSVSDVDDLEGCTAARVNPRLYEKKPSLAIVRKSSDGTDATIAYGVSDEEVEFSSSGDRTQLAGFESDGPSDHRDSSDVPEGELADRRSPRIEQNPEESEDESVTDIITSKNPACQVLIQPPSKSLENRVQDFIVNGSEFSPRTLIRSNSEPRLYSDTLSLSTVSAPAKEESTLSVPQSVTNRSSSYPGASADSNSSPRGEGEAKNVDRSPPAPLLRRYYDVSDSSPGQDSEPGAPVLSPCEVLLTSAARSGNLSDIPETNVNEQRPAADSPHTVQVNDDTAHEDGGLSPHQSDDTLHLTDSSNHQNDEPDHEADASSRSNDEQHQNDDSSDRINDANDRAASPIFVPSSEVVGTGDQDIDWGLPCAAHGKVCCACEGLDVETVQDVAASPMIGKWWLCTPGTPAPGTPGNVLLEHRMVGSPMPVEGMTPYRYPASPMPGAMTPARTEVLDYAKTVRSPMPLHSPVPHVRAESVEDPKAMNEDPSSVLDKSAGGNRPKRVASPEFQTSAKRHQSISSRTPSQTETESAAVLEGHTSKTADHESQKTAVEYHDVTCHPQSIQPHRRTDHDEEERREDAEAVEMELIAAAEESERTMAKLLESSPQKSLFDLSFNHSETTSTKSTENTLQTHGIGDSTDPLCNEETIRDVNTADSFTNDTQSHVSAKEMPEIPEQRETDQIDQTKCSIDENMTDFIASKGNRESPSHAVARETMDGDYKEAPENSGSITEKQTLSESFPENQTSPGNFSSKRTFSDNLTEMQVLPEDDSSVSQDKITKEIQPPDERKALPTHEKELSLPRNDDYVSPTASKFETKTESDAASKRRTETTCSEKNVPSTRIHRMDSVPSSSKPKPRVKMKRSHSFDGVTAAVKRFKHNEGDGECSKSALDICLKPAGQTHHQEVTVAHLTQSVTSTVRENPPASIQQVSEDSTESPASGTDGSEEGAMLSEEDPSKSTERTSSVDTGQEVEQNSLPAAMPEQMDVSEKSKPEETGPAESVLAGEANVETALEDSASDAEDRELAAVTENMSLDSTPEVKTTEANSRECNQDNTENAGNVSLPNPSSPAGTEDTLTETIVESSLPCSHSGSSPTPSVSPSVGGELSESATATTPASVYSDKDTSVLDISSETETGIMEAEDCTDKKTLSTTAEVSAEPSVNAETSAGTAQLTENSAVAETHRTELPMSEKESLLCHFRENEPGTDLDVMSHADVREHPSGSIVADDVRTTIVSVGETSEAACEMMRCDTEETICETKCSESERNLNSVSLDDSLTDDGVRSESVSLPTCIIDRREVNRVDSVECVGDNSERTTSEPVSSDETKDERTSPVGSSTERQRCDEIQTPADESDTAEVSVASCTTDLRDSEMSDLSVKNLTADSDENSKDMRVTSTEADTSHITSSSNSESSSSDSGGVSVRQIETDEGDRHNQLQVLLQEKEHLLEEYRRKTAELENTVEALRIELQETKRKHKELQDKTSLNRHRTDKAVQSEHAHREPFKLSSLLTGLR